MLEVLASNGNIALYAGNGGTSTYPTNGDGGAATSATVYYPTALATDSKGNLYIVDGNWRVRKVTASTGIITTVAGGDLNATGIGDGGPATSTYLYSPNGIALDSSGNLYIAEENRGRVRMVNAQTGIISTVAGDGDAGESGDGLPATQAEVSPQSIASDGKGNLYFANNFAHIRRVDASTGVISSVAGMGFGGYSGDGGSPLVATLCPGSGLALDSGGNLYFTDECGYAVRKIAMNLPAPAPTFNPPAGSYTGPQSVTISDAAPNATIYYTLDGSQPGATSPQYSGSIEVTGNETINAIAIASGYAQSSEGSAAYTITPATPPITWPTPAAIAYGIALSSTQLDATANVPGTFAYSPAAGTILSAGQQMLSVTFTPQANMGYTTATATVTLTVNPAIPTIAWAAPAAITYGTPLGSAQLNATASVPGTFAYSPAAGAVLGAGSQKLSTTFTPTDATDYTTATASVTLSVIPATPTIALTSSQNPSTVSQSVTFTATLSSPAGTPTGSVTFYDGTTKLGSGTLAAGVAAYSTSALAPGSQSITAQYSGDANFVCVTSAALGQAVTSFSIAPAPGAPATATGAPGSPVNFLLSVTPPASSPVTFSVAGLPQGYNAEFSPTSVPAGAGPTQIVLTINIPAQVAASPAPASPGFPSRFPVALGLIVLPLLGLRRSLRRGRRLLALAFLAVAGLLGSAALSGCGSHFNASGSTGNPTPPGTYTLTVTATAGTQTQSTTLTLNVQ